MTEDPEARIADLERGLSIPEGAPDTTTPGRTALRIGWIVLGLLIAVLALSGVVILSGQTQRTVPGGAVAADPPPFQPPTPPRRPTSLPVVPTSIPRSLPDQPAPPGGAINVAGSGNNRTVACNESVVFVSGVDNTVTITGHCVRVDISGVENTVTINASDSITVSGVRNTVLFLTGAPRLSRSGIDNTINGS